MGFKVYGYKFRREPRSSKSLLMMKLILLILQDLVRVLLGFVAVVGVRQRSLEGLGKD